MESSPNLSEPTEVPPGPVRPTKRGSKFIACLCWSYLLLLCAVVIAIRTLGDRAADQAPGGWAWPVTLLLFSPRWLGLLPLVLLVPLALWRRRRMLWVLLAAAAVAVFPLMGFNIGWQRFSNSSIPGQSLRVLAFNIHHDRLTDPAVEQYFRDAHPDLVSLEETPPGLNARLFPRDQWHIIGRGEILVASRYPIISVKELFDSAAVQYEIATPAGPIDFFAVHLSSPHYALRDAVRETVRSTRRGQVDLSETNENIRDLIRNIRERQDQADFLSALAASSTRPMIIAGDFNLVPDSRLFHPKFPAMTDSFEAVGFGFGWTYSNKWTMVRIDHVLHNSSLRTRTFQQGPWLTSPHRPILAELVIR